MARVLHASVVFLSFFLQSSHADTESLNNVLFNGDYEFIDLSHPFDNKTVYWPGNRRFEFTKKTEKYTGNDDYSWYAANEFAAAEHGGTHLDAPYHFYMGGFHVGELPLKNLIVPLIIADISPEVNDNPNYVLHKHDVNCLNSLKGYLDQKLNISQPCAIIFKFGWSKYYSSAKYLGINEQTKTLNFPGLSAEVVEWFTTSYNNIVGIGVDVASLDPGSSEDFPVHKITAKLGLYNMENVNLNHSVPDDGCTALVLPMKISQGSGAPLRLVAICPKKAPIE